MPHISDEFIRGVRTGIAAAIQQAPFDDELALEQAIAAEVLGKSGDVRRVERED